MIYFDSKDFSPVDYNCGPRMTGPDRYAQSYRLKDYLPARPGGKNPSAR